MLEQPATSLMLLFQPILMLIRQAYKAVRHVCLDGAPWKKPTALLSNDPCIRKLDGTCPGCKTHISLVGRCPDGRYWAAVASSYWPAFARAMAMVWDFVLDDALTAESGTAGSTMRCAGLLAPSGELTVNDIIHDMGFEPSGRRDPLVVARRSVPASSLRGGLCRNFYPTDSCPRSICR